MAVGAAAADRVAGQVVDQSGQPLPRAFVHVVGTPGSGSAGVFTDDRGGFDLAGAADSGCRVEASLTGFTTASVACSDRAVRIVLSVAPIEETLVVTATRTTAPADQVGASVTTFTAEDIERRQTPLIADVLRATPGAMIVRSGQPGALTSLYVRGGESNYNKVLVDGIPLNEPGGTFYFSNLSTENLDRIEVVRGAQSALFGSDAMSSVVQLFTKRATTEGKPDANFSIEGGSFGTVRAAGNVSGRASRWDYALDAAQFSTSNDTPNSDFDNTTLSANVGAALNETANLRFIARAELGKNGTPGQTAFGRPDLDAFAERHDGLGGVTFNQQLTPNVHQQASYALSVSNQQSTNLIEDPPYTPTYGGRTAPFEYSDFLYDSRTNLRRHHASYQADVVLANNASSGQQMLSVLADWDGERATLDDRLAGTSTPASRDNFGLAAQHQALWRRVSFNVSGRYEHNASFGNAFVPRGAVAVTLHQAGGDPVFGATSLHAAAGAGIKEPTLLQSFSPVPFYRGNPDLQPERSRSVEIGIDQRLSSDRVRVGVTWFDNEYKNLIALETTNFETFEAQYFNVGKSRARGAEFLFEVVPVDALHVRAGYTLLDSEVLESTSPDSPVYQIGQPLLRRPKHTGFFDVSWSRNKLSVGVYGMFIGEFVDSDFSSLDPPMLVNPGWTTWDARIAWKLMTHVTATLSIDNIGDASYMEALGYPALGRAVRAGVRVGF
jgi:outer membrane cobalamin receptor